MEASFYMALLLPFNVSLCKQLITLDVSIHALFIRLSRKLVSCPMPSADCPGLPSIAKLIHIE